MPVYNDERRIAQCLDALSKQSYPRSRYEVIVVDNGSTDGTRAVVERHAVTCVEESRARNSYVARNRGLELSRGEIVAFTDSDCVPCVTWLEEGVGALLREDAALAGGAVRFTFSTRPTGAELYDSVTNMQVERNIRERQVAKTANLFARATVVEAVGKFPENARSGGDVIWTSRSTQQGFKLVYAERAVVTHPARKLRELVAKQYRVGRGQPRVWAEESERGILRLLAGVARFAAFPEKPSRIRCRLLDRGIEPSRAHLARAWLAGYVARLATAAGQIHGAVSPTQLVA